MYTVLQNSLPKYSIRTLNTVIRKCTSIALYKTENAIVSSPISDLSYKDISRRRKAEEWYDKIKKLESVEEKLFGINMPHYYGWKSLQLVEGKFPYNSLDHAQYITRTHVTSDYKLPEFYDTVITAEHLDSLVQTVKGYVQDVIIFEYSHRLRRQERKEKAKVVREKLLQDAVTKAVVYQMNRIMLAALSSTIPHLLETEVDFEPRMEAFWFAGGIERSPSSKKSKQNRGEAREKISDLTEYVNAPITLPVQYYGSPILQLRHRFPLKEVVNRMQSTNPELTIPTFKFDPRVLGYHFARKHATCIPGFWPGDPAEFGLLSYHSLNNSSLNPSMDEEKMITQAVFASYSWLLSQACYQGFSTVNDITYPLVSQTILTNGQSWSFCVYQLNTTLLYSEHVDENPKRNICWITKPIMLFDKVEDGKIHGFNEEVLKKLITFYINMPAERSNENMKPYLGESVNYIADITDPERRTWLESRFKHLMSNRPRHFKIPEIYHWQKIYILDHKMRTLDKKRDPWQFGFSISKRRLNEHLPIYVPRCLRKNPKKRKVGRWAKTYYPDA